MKCHAFSIILLGLFVFQKSNLIAQDGPYSFTIPNAADNIATIQIPDAGLQPLSTLIPPPPDPFYQFFLVFGDGNYHYSAGQMYPGTSTSSTVYSITNPYLNVNNIEYRAEGFAIDRKSNNPPPSKLIGVVQETPSPIAPTVGGTAPTDMVNVKDFPTNKSPAILDIKEESCKRVRLEHSHHFLEQEDWSAFIMAYHPMLSDVDPNKSPNEKLIFFYERPFKNQVWIHEPNYSVNANPKQLYDPGTDKNSMNDPLYANYIIHDISDIEFSFDNLTDGKEELRKFDFLQAEEPIMGFVDDRDYNFMVILATEDPSSSRDCAATNYAEDASFVGNYIDLGDDFKLTVPGLVDYKYIDADTIKVKSGKPKDPNELKVVSVCECPNGNYRVVFELEFCNISQFPTSASSLFIEEVGNTNYFTCFKPVSNDFGINEKVQEFSSCTPSQPCPKCNDNLNTKCAAYNLCTSCDAHYCVEYDEIYTSSHSPDDCHTFTFEAQTDQNGVFKLNSPQRAIKVTVNFHETDCEVLTAWSNQTDISVNTVRGCEPAQCTGCTRIGGGGPGVIFYGLTAVLLAAAAWLIFRWRRG